MKNKELLPCPFCGGEVNILVFGGVYMVQCENCRIATDIDTEKETAIKVWNTRTNKITVGNGEDYEVTHNDI